MFTSLPFEVRTWPTAWRRRLAYWFSGAKDGLAFFAMLALPVLGVLGIVYFAYRAGTRIEPVRIEPVRIEPAQWQARYAQQRADELQCLAENVYFEARGEPLNGQYAVAEVTLNRTRALHFPHTICQVVHESRWDPSRRRYVADFSWTELGSLMPEDGPAWQQAMEVASNVYDDLRDPLVPGALFYHATNVRPRWAKSRKAIATIGNHIFYR